jgi:hypothetical protein
MGAMAVRGRCSSIISNGLLSRYQNMSPSMSASVVAGTESSGSLVESKYTYMDEEYLRCLQSQMHWDRDHGIIHLMPIAVVYQDDIY